MVDFHYIKRGSKIYGPYYYRSYRAGKKVKKEYLGKDYPKNIHKKKKIRLLFFVLLFSLILGIIPAMIFSRITGKTILDTNETYSQSNETLQSSAGNLTAEILGSIFSEIPQANLSESSNMTLIETANMDNGTGLEQTNETGYPVEQRDTNESFFLINATEQPAEVNVAGINETLVQDKAVIGKPVRWVKKVVLEKPGNVTIELPQDASNVTVRKIEHESSEIIPMAYMSITGKITATLNLTGKKKKPTFFDILKYLFRNIRAGITGHAISETAGTGEMNNTVEIKENVSEIEVEYYTDAPQATEEQIPQGKKIIISGPDELHYQDILAYTYLDKEIKDGKGIVLYWINGSEKQKVDFTAYDTNNNSLIDYIEWNVPHLSNQTYELSITETNVQKYPAGLGEELADKRTYNQKVFDAGEGKQRYIIYTAQINYKDEQGNFQEINTTLNFDEKEKAWEQSNASYHSKIPEYADDWFEFYNVYEGANQTIKAKPAASHIKGEYFKESDGSQGVIYRDAFGKGIDLKVYAYWAGLKKVIIINGKPADISKDLTFDFELELPVSNIKNKDKNGKDIVTSDIQVKDTQGNLWDKSATLDFKDKTLKIGDDGKESYFQNAWIWDSGELSQPVDIELYTKGSKIFLRKTITADILEKAVYPLYTDHPTNYNVGTGDGYSFFMADPWTWDGAHDATAGTGSSTFYRIRAYTTENFGFGVCRGFIPIDTSGIEDTAVISSASLWMKTYTSSNDGDNDGDDWINIVETFQTDPTALVNADFEDCGYDVGSETGGRAKYTPVEGSTRLDLTGLTANSVREFVLNTAGIGWISKTGYTKLGLREGHDCLDSPIANTKFNDITFQTTSDAYPPFLDVTAGIPNTAPFIQNISITPAAAHTDSTLNCSANYGDAESDKGNVSITWYNASAQYSTTTILNVVAGAMVSNATLSGIQALGETWNCTINATDAQGLSGAPNSTTRAIVSNSAPNITSISITPNIAYTDSTLNCSGVYSDANSDKGNVSITWYNGSTQYSTATILNVVTEQMVSNATLAAIQAIGEIWNCTINATDSVGNAGLPNSTVTLAILGRLVGLVVDASNNNQKVASAQVVIVNQSNNASIGNTLTNSTGGWVFNISQAGRFLAIAYYNTTLRGAASPYIDVT